ncbi:hypothetical protein [Nocardia sp. CA-119907]
MLQSLPAALPAGHDLDDLPADADVRTRIEPAGFRHQMNNG